MKKDLLRICTVTGLALLCVRCAPDNAREIRELRPTTAGWLGGEYRPDGSMGFGLTGDYSRQASLDVFGLLPTASKDRQPEILGGYALNAFYHHYIWDTSAFFWGAGLGYMNSRYKWRERTNAYTDASKSYTEVKYDDAATYLRVPLGWNWIWNNGITLLLDFGPSFRITHQTSWPEAGTDVDQSRRNDFRDDVASPSFRFGGSGLIGYSF